MVSEHGSFNPYGAVMYVNGEIQWMAVTTGEEFPLGQVLIDGLTDMFREKAVSGEIRAAAICYDARTVPPGQATKFDVISFSLEHRSEDSVSAFLPYVRDAAGNVEYFDLFTVARTPQFFVES